MRLILTLFFVSLSYLCFGQPAQEPEDPWFNIKYECYGKDQGHTYEGVEILQVVKNATPEYLDIEVQLRLKDLHPRYHRHIFIDKYSDFNRGTREDWLVLIGAGDKPSGTVWKSPVVRIPRTWSWRDEYSATWNDERQRYQLSNWKDETPYNRSSEIEMFGVHIECYEHDPEPVGQDRYSDSYDGMPEENILREW